MKGSTAEAMRRFGVVDPLREMENHAELKHFLGAVKEIDRFGPGIGELVAGLIVVANKQGVHEGRMDALSNPAKAMGEEVANLIAMGISEAELIDLAKTMAVRGD